jgi:tetratricopeptide (TPR) repeat protein
LLDLARRDPVKAVRAGSTFLGEIPAELHDVRSVAYRALSIAARYGSTMSDSIDYARSAVVEATASADHALRAQALMTLAGTLALSGENDKALEALDQAAAGSTGHLLAEIEFQRGATFQKLGENRRARECYSRALPVFEEHDDRESIAMTTNNLGSLEIVMGDLPRARRLLERSRRLNLELGHTTAVSWVDHNLGIVAGYEGDIPEALRLFDDSEGLLRGMVDLVSEVQVSRCEVLLSAGLFREAVVLAETVASDLHRVGLAQDEAEAWLVGAQAALLAGDADKAVAWAERASGMFAAQRRRTGAANARLIAIQVRAESDAAHPRALEQARAAAQDLEDEGEFLGARRAWLIAGLIGARSGAGDRGVADLTRVAHDATGPIETRLQSRLARAMVRLAEGDRRGADAAARSGMRMLDEFQAALGATDVRMGVERHGRELGSLGLRLALESCDSRRFFRWMELRRGRALLYRPVTPPADERLAGQMAELRRVAAEMRHAGGEEAVELVKRQQQLQSAVRDRARVARRQMRANRHLDPAAIAAGLGDATLVEFASLDEVLWAVTVIHNRFRLIKVGPASGAERESESLRFAMRRLARGRGSVAAVKEGVRRLDDLLFDPLRIGDSPLVIVPTPGLHALPWRALPTCRDRAVTISPSAELWYRARASSPGGSGVTIAAGPDLDLSDAEARAVSRLYPGSKPLPSAKASVGKVLTQLDGASIAHIASHASFQFENPMFSSLRLADGDLNVYDIERLETAPDLVVLSACDSGFTDTHAGEELMGLSSALLSMGTRSIIASVGLVPDSHATKDLMVALHRGLVAGLAPSVALHEAQARMGETPEGFVAASSFICIGAG